MSKLQVSLGPFVLLVLLVSVALLWMFTKHELAEKQAENSLLKDTYGVLKVDDPSMACFLRVDNVGTRCWKWRIHVPAGKQIRFCVASHDIPDFAVPAKPDWDVNWRFDEDQQIELLIRLEESESLTWCLRFTDPHFGLKRVILLPKETQSWIQGEYTTDTHDPAITKTLSDKSAVLLRIRKKTVTSDKSPPVNPFETSSPTEGFMIYIDHKDAVTGDHSFSGELE